MGQSWLNLIVPSWDFILLGRCGSPSWMPVTSEPVYLYSQKGAVSLVLLFFLRVICHRVSTDCITSRIAFFPDCIFPGPITIQIFYFSATVVQRSTENLQDLIAAPVLVMQDVVDML